MFVMLFKLFFEFKMSKMVMIKCVVGLNNQVMENVFIVSDGFLVKFRVVGGLIDECSKVRKVKELINKIFELFFFVQFKIFKINFVVIFMFIMSVGWSCFVGNLLKNIQLKNLNIYFEKFVVE